MLIHGHLPIDATDKDGDKGKDNSPAKLPKLDDDFALSGTLVFLVCRHGRHLVPGGSRRLHLVSLRLDPLSQNSSGLLDTEPVVDHIGATDDHDEDLKGNAEDDDVVSEVDAVLIHHVSGDGHGENTRTNELYNNADEVGADHEQGDEARPQHGVLGPAVHDDVLEGDGDGGGDEGRRNDQSDELHGDTECAPRVVVHEETPRVADELDQGAEGERRRIGPCANAEEADGA